MELNGILGQISDTIGNSKGVKEHKGGKCVEYNSKIEDVKSFNNYIKYK